MRQGRMICIKRLESYGIIPSLRSPSLVQLSSYNMNAWIYSLEHYSRPCIAVYVEMRNLPLPHFSFGRCSFPPTALSGKGLRFGWWRMSAFCAPLDGHGHAMDLTYVFSPSQSIMVPNLPVTISCFFSKIDACPWDALKWSPMNASRYDDNKCNTLNWQSPFAEDNENDLTKLAQPCRGPCDKVENNAQFDWRLHSRVRTTIIDPTTNMQR